MRNSQQPTSTQSTAFSKLSPQQLFSFYSPINVVERYGEITFSNRNYIYFLNFNFKLIFSFDSRISFALSTHFQIK